MRVKAWCVPPVAMRGKGMMCAPSCNEGKRHDVCPQLQWGWNAWCVPPVVIRENAWCVPLVTMRVKAWCEPPVVMRIKAWCVPQVVMRVKGVMWAPPHGKEVVITATFYGQTCLSFAARLQWIIHNLTQWHVVKHIKNCLWTHVECSDINYAVLKQVKIQQKWQSRGYELFFQTV